MSQRKRSSSEPKGSQSAPKREARVPRAQPVTLVVQHPHAAGIDVHSDMHMVCVPADGACRHPGVARSGVTAARAGVPATGRQRWLRRIRRGARLLFIAMLACWWLAVGPGGAEPEAKADPTLIRVVTWNIHCVQDEGLPWEQFDWSVRKHALRAALEQARPDILSPVVGVGASSSHGDRPRRRIFSIRDESFLGHCRLVPCRTNVPKE
jgi:hypothetical protein